MHATRVSKSKSLFDHQSCNSTNTAMGYPLDKPVKIPIDLIAADPALQARVKHDHETIDDYAEAMRSGEEFPAAILFFDGETYWLADGFQRHLAAVKAGLKDLLVVIKKGHRRDAILYAVGANAKHGLRRTNADKRKAVAILLGDAEWSRWSDREIARRCGVSNRFVGNLRDELTVNGSQIDETRKVTRGESEPEQSVVVDQSLKDDNGGSVPERLLPIFANVTAFTSGASAAERAATTLRHLEETPAYRFLEGWGKGDHRRYSTLFFTGSRSIEAMRPACVCPNCQGIEASQGNDLCKRCEGKGFLTADEI